MAHKIVGSAADDQDPLRSTTAADPRVALRASVNAASNVEADLTVVEGFFRRVCEVIGEGDVTPVVPLPRGGIDHRLVSHAVEYIAAERYVPTGRLARCQVQRENQALVRVLTPAPFPGTYTGAHK